jgi:hypothetical protein
LAREVAAAGHQDRHLTQNGRAQHEAPGNGGFVRFRVPGPATPCQHEDPRPLRQYGNAVGRPGVGS